MTEQKTENITIQDLIRPVRRNWVLVFIAFFTVVLTVGLYTWSVMPEYESVGTVIVNKSGTVVNQLFDMPSAMMEKYLVKNQLAVLQSRRLAANIISRLENGTRPDSLMILGFTPRDHVPSFLDRLKNIVFSSNTAIPEMTFNEKVKNFQDATDVRYQQDTDILELTARSPQAWEAAYLVNTWMDTYLDFERMGSNGNASETAAFLEQKLRDIEQRLHESERALALYQKQKQVVSLTDETAQLVTQLTDFESLYNQTITELEATENQIQYLNSQLDENKKNLVENMEKISSPALQQLQNQLGELMAEKATYEAQLMGAGYSIYNDSRLNQLNNRIRGLQDRIVKETKNLVSGDFTGINPLGQSENLITEILKQQTNRHALMAKAASLKRIVDQYNRKLMELPDKNIELTRLERDVQVNSKIYVMVKERYEEAKLRGAAEGSVADIVDRAQVPEYPVYPNKMMNMAFAGIFGFLLGIGLAFSRDFFEDTVRSTHDLESMYLRVIGKISSVRKTRYKRFRREGGKDTTLSRAKEIFPNLLTHKNGNADMEEDYQSVCTSLLYTVRHNKWKTIVFSSPGPYEGKSTTIANVAITMARKGVKTLLVDTDLRRPVLDILFMNSHRKVGVTNRMCTKNGWRDALRETSVRGLDLLPAGPAIKNAPDLLSSKSMFRFIQEAKREYGLILLDSPPLLPVTDGTILASLVDGVIIIVNAGKTTRESVQKSVELVNSVDGNLLGIVLTNAKSAEVYGYRDYYRHYRKKQTA